VNLATPSVEFSLETMDAMMRSFVADSGRIPAHPIIGPLADGSRSHPFNLVLHSDVEPYLRDRGYEEDDVIQLNGYLGSWWRIVFSRYIPHRDVGYEVD
jgi:hypothetical protein